MKLRLTGMVIGVLAVTVGHASAAPADVAIIANSTSQTKDCAGGNAAISGNLNKLTLQNCDAVAISGNENTVRVESAKVISVTGNGNTIVWAVPTGGATPLITNVGTNNRISGSAGDAGSAKNSASVRRDGAATASASDTTTGNAKARSSSSSAVKSDSTGVTRTNAASSAYVVNADGKTLTHDCRGGSAMVNGNRNKLKLQNCAAIVVSGNFNVVDVTSVQSLTLPGNDNAVTWRAAGGGDPVVSDVGSRNKVAQR